MAKRRESAIFFCRRKDRVLVVYKEFPDFPVIPPKKTAEFKNSLLLFVTGVRENIQKQDSL